MTSDSLIYWLGGLTAGLIYLAGLWAVYDAIVKVRTSQGAVAWVISLITFPYIALFLYLFFGHSRFHGYVNARRVGDRDIQYLGEHLKQSFHDISLSGGIEDRFRVFQELAGMPFTLENRAGLLVDGEATFDSILRGISGARRYVLFQFFIIRDDGLGNRVRDALIERAKAGVQVYLLYDEIGSYQLRDSFLQPLREAGVAVNDFRGKRGLTYRFQINFRNHRKSVVVDGETAWVGGHNVADEYLGKSKRFGPWRDTHVLLQGPSVQAVQLCFVEDWYWSTGAIPDLEWKPKPAPGGSVRTLVLPSGPADQVETCTLMFLQAIHAARQRFWISSPYFVPEREIICALQLAAMRGVDVRILLPDKPDHLMVWLSGFAYLQETDKVGITFYRYQPGFLHQKVMVVDDEMASVGTANLDNRSFRLNFELTVLFVDREANKAAADMLEQDFENSRRADASDYHNKPFWFKFAVSASRLFAPVQ